MLKNYIKIAFRNLKKDKQFTFLNVLGLSAGLACTLLIYLWVHDELSYDKFFDNDNQVYQIMEHRTGGGSQQISDESSGLVSDVLKTQVSEDVQYAAAVAPADWWQKFTLTVGDKNIKASGQYVGKDYFNIFSFKMLHGERGNVLAAKADIVISDELAKKLFTTVDNAIGKSVRFQHDKEFAVTGVFEKLPVHSSQQFDFVLSFDYLADVQGWVKTWNNGGPHNFVMLKKGVNLAVFNKKILNLVKKNSGDTTRSAVAMRFSDNYLKNTFNHGARVGGREEYVKLFSVIAVFILLIACINFMNLSTAKASGRMKEVGIKKVVGAKRGQLIAQFLSESLLMAIFTMVLAIGIAWALLPQFNQLTGKQIRLEFTPQLIIMLAGITLFTGLVSGSYPALYLSKFNPLAILKGKLSSSFTELLARKGLVVFQFTLSVALIVAVLVVYRQIQYIQHTKPGYNKDNLIRIDSEGKLAGNEENFAAELKNIPGVLNASFTQHNMVGRNFGTAGLSWDGKQSNGDVYFEGFFGGFNFIETMDMQMAAGRSFNKNYGAEGSKVILNQTAVKAMQLQNPVGRTIKVLGNTCQVIGVVKDYHFESLHEVVRPSFILLAQGSSPYFKMMIRLKGDHQKETIAKIQQLYESFNPGFPFAYSFLDEAYQKQYETEVRVSALAQYFSFLAILISCLGLFGLVAFTAQKRQKEIGIRKVIGASVNSIMIMLTQDFLKLVAIAVIIAFPISWYAMSRWLQGFVYRIDIGPVVFVIAAMSVMVITLFTVGFQAIKAALANPVKSLRSE
ncbi:ABC transporter permease [Mucilaginibacter ginsenosidivorax]|uniref:FtsX-like permease family protein n=1 Tax=Mucilaginibacter ginsenosidivorax TaxID=862126 RepID=A0A5B8W0H9_9SPHI|nr:ABC transporter permease [Mucilaginibacter ginsenosidivorax]QEC76342.1 FtsX-like permease family protein [Mucilaginibacter ginsenosidivorax]